MRILTNELKYAKLLRRSGFKPAQAESIMSMIAEMEIHNVYSSCEIDMMLSEAVEKIFTRNDRVLEEQRREFDEKMKLMDKYYDRRLTQADEKLTINRNESREFRKDFHEEIKSSRRWLIGTIITVGMGLAAYLSAIIKLSH